MDLTNIALGTLVLYVMWVVLLVLTVGASRAILMFRDGTQANQFTAGVPHGPEGYWRLNRAHLNAVENLPIFATLVIVGRILGLDSGPLFVDSCMAILLARMFQSIVHVYSGRSRFVIVRFCFFAIQVVCYFILGFIILLPRKA